MNIAAARNAAPDQPATRVLSLVTEVTPPAAVPTEAAGSVAPAGAPKRAYPPPAETPTQEGPKGLRFDFNDGARVLLSESEHPWKVRISDLDTGNILFQTEIKAGRVNSSKRYFVRFRVEAWQKDERLIVHDYSA